jgi:uncharacterized protein
VGVVSGLIGIGGGVLIVPFLYFLMGATWSGLQVLPEHEAALAHATSLAIIVPTALSGLHSYRRKGLVTWSSVLALGASAAVAAFLGARVAVLLPSLLLKTVFGLFLLGMAWRVGVVEAAGGKHRRGIGGGGDARRADGAGAMPRGKAVVGGGLVGFFSALLGVGGGAVAIPVLIHWGRLDLHRVAAASLGIIAFAAFAGSAGYALAGRGVEGLPGGALGFVHLPLLAVMLPGAVLLAPLGARWNQALPVATLRRVFAIILLVMGLQLAWSNGAALLGAFA